MDKENMIERVISRSEFVSIWDQFSTEQKSIIRKGMINQFSDYEDVQYYVRTDDGKEERYDDPWGKYPFKFLTSIAIAIPEFNTTDEERNIANKVYEIAESYDDDLDSSFSFYQAVSRLFVPGLEILEECLNKSIEIAKRKNKTDRLSGTMKKAVINYEKAGYISKAIDYSKKAMEMGLNDGTKNGYTGRIAKLQKKL